MIVDIDGTLSNSCNRRVFDFKACVDDKVIEPVKKLVSMAWDQGHTIIMMSGRDSICREETEDWLYKKYINYDLLYMRKEKDNRQDTIVKQELFDNHIRGKYQPMFVIDDRPCVLQMWIELGLFVMNVNQDPYATNKF